MFDVNFHHFPQHEWSVILVFCGPQGTLSRKAGGKYFGALLVGFYENKRLKFAGRVGTGFCEKLLHDLYAELNKIQVEACPFLTSRLLVEALRTKG